MPRWSLLKRRRNGSRSDSGYGDGAKANSRGHSSTRQAAALAREAGVGKLIITHVSSRYDDKGCQHLLRECRSIFPATELANDFAVFSI